MIRGIVRALSMGVVSALVVIGLAGAAHADCNCFCKVSKDLGASPGSSIPNFLIQYPGMPTFGNCTVGVPGKKQTCSKACSDATANDSSQWASDQWLCSKLGPTFNGKVVAYSAIGTHNYDSAAARNVNCTIAPAVSQVMAACEKEGLPVSLNLSTGAGAIGSKDPRWTVSGGGTAPAAYSTTKVSSWVAPPTASTNWIQPATGGSPNSGLPGNTTFVYKTSFTVPLCAYLLGGITLKGTYSADNRAEIWMNNNQLTAAACTTATCFQSLDSFDVSSLVGPGLNTLEFRVKNDGSYSGLVVDASAVSKCERCKH
jgi:hypothetical protein